MATFSRLFGVFALIAAVGCGYVRALRAPLPEPCGDVAYGDRTIGFVRDRILGRNLESAATHTASDALFADARSPSDFAVVRDQRICSTIIGGLEEDMREWIEQGGRTYWVARVASHYVLGTFLKDTPDIAVDDGGFGYVFDAFVIVYW